MPNKGATPEMMREIWQEHRGPLSEVRALSSERAARCQERISHSIRKCGSASQLLADFREAVARAAATPFLCGNGPAGWRANFDWLIANNTNYLKVLEGRYDAGAGISSATNSAVRDAAITREESVRRELAVGARPTPTQSDTHVRAGVIARIFGRS